MIGAYASLAAVVLASLLVGQAVLSLCGRRDLAWLSGPVGLAALLAIAGIAVDLPGEVTTVAVCLLVATAAAVVSLAVRRPSGLGPLGAGLPAAMLAVLAASIPFIVAGRVGILGVGLVNDDMASHLLLAAWLDEGFSPEPVLVDQGYPLGPHALVAGLEGLLGTNEVNAFAGLTLAIPALAALTAFGALEGLRPLARSLSAAVVALPFLIAAYLAQEAFKEPIMALLLLAFALALPAIRGARDAAILGVLAAGAVYVYSFPGLVWLGGAALAWALIELVRGRQAPASPPRRTDWSLRVAIGTLSAQSIAVAVAVAVLLVLPDLGRMLDFADFRALDPDRANEGGLGNLRGHLSPLEALGIWPTSEFRLSAGAGSLPAILFYAGAALGLAALALGLPRWVRRHGPAIPAALAAALLVYVGARSFGTVYTSAKALAVASPLICLIVLGGLLGARSAWRLVLAGLFIAGAGLSSFLVLRQAPVGPVAHASELAQIRPLVEGEKLLFLGRDNFVLYELRGSRPYTHVRNFYDPYFVEPNFELREVASKFDFDAVAFDKLSKFPYVLTTRAAYASGPPPGYEVAAETPSYVLWEAPSETGNRRPVETGPEPVGPLACPPPVRGQVVIPAASPVVAQSWLPTTIEDGSEATITLDLPEGRWALSLRYDSTGAVTLTGPGLDAELPANLDYRGTGPYWPAGEVVSEGEPLAIRASVEGPSAIGSRLGANTVAHLGEVAATAIGPSYVRGIEPPYPGQGVRSARIPACGDDADWIRPPGP